jgi:hypothetical protein
VKLIPWTFELLDAVSEPGRDDNKELSRVGVGV